MHDPTEGGLASALWEFSTASGYALEINPERIPIPEISAKICKRFHLNPLNTIASGALLLSVEAQDSAKIIQALEKADIPCSKIGLVTDREEVSVSDIKNKNLLPWPEQDDITKVFQHENRLF
jgi:hydrogenase maturation factor